MALRSSPAERCEIKRRREPANERVWRQYLCPRRRELDRERHPVEAPAHLCDVGRIVGSQLEVRAHPTRLPSEQLHCRRAARLVESRNRRQSQRRDGVLLLGQHVKRSTRRRDHGEIREGREQVVDDGGRVVKLLKVVEDEERRSMSEVVGHAVAIALVGRETKDVRDRRNDLCGVARGLQRHEIDTVREAVDERMSKCDCKARLS